MKVVMIIMSILFFHSCTIFGTAISSCQVKGNLKDGIGFYPLKPSNQNKKIRNFYSYSIEIKQKISDDSLNNYYNKQINSSWNWSSSNLRSKNGVITYGQKNGQTEIKPKGLNYMSEYGVGMTISSLFNGRIICGCKFRINEKGEVENIPLKKMDKE